MEPFLSSAAPRRAASLPCSGVVKVKAGRGTDRPSRRPSETSPSNASPLSYWRTPTQPPPRVEVAREGVAALPLHASLPNQHAIFEDPLVHYARRAHRVPALAAREKQRVGPLLGTPLTRLSGLTLPCNLDQDERVAVSDTEPAMGPTWCAPSNVSPLAYVTCGIAPPL